jgi:hypothetical protein
MGVNDVYNITQIDMDLLKPYDPTLTISNKPTNLTDTINDLRKTSIQNNGVYNNVQIGSSYGIRVTRSDNKVITTMNATEGISIENDTKKVFSVDTNGNLVINDITANNGTYNNITVNKGKFNDIDVDEGTFNNITATDGLTIEDGDATCKIDQSGVELTMGDYTSKMAVRSNDQGNGTAIEFSDCVSIGSALGVHGPAFIDGDTDIGGVLSIKGKGLGDLIEIMVKDLVKPESLK